MKVYNEDLALVRRVQNIIDKGFNETTNENQLTKAEKEKLEANRMADAKALLKCRCRMESLPLFFPRIITANTSKQLWEILPLEFQGDSKAITSIVMQRILNMKMKELLFIYFF